MTKPLLIFLIVLQGLFAQDVGDWQTLTYMNNINGLISDGNRIWAVSDGGLFSYNVDTREIKKFTNLNGLRSIQLTNITKDSYHQIILGGQRGIIQYYNPLTDRWQYQYALEGTSITHLVSQQDTLWVSTNEGIGVFLFDGQEYVFKDFFRNFPVVIEKVFTHAVFAGKIWLGTDKGLLVAPSDFGRFTINDPQRWQVMTTSHNLPANQVNVLFPLDEKLWVGTSQGLAYVDKQNRITVVTNWWINSSNQYLPVHHVVNHFDTLIVASYNHLGRYEINTGTKLLKTFEETIQALVIDYAGNKWIGLRNGGLANLKGDLVKVDGPPQNLMRTVMVNSKGQIWSSSSRPKIISQGGIFFYDGQLWKKYEFSGRYWQAVNNANVIYEDRFKNLWFGTWGGGVMAIKANGDTVFFHSFDFSGQLTISDINETRVLDPAKFTIYRHFFNGVVIDSNYEVITAIKEGPHGRLWFANYWAADGNLLAAVPYDENGFISLNKEDWIHFGVDDGIVAKEGGVLCIEFDKFTNRIYIGTLENGVFYLDYGNTLEDKSDDRLYQLTIQDNLFSNTIFSLAMDQDGVLWIGTAAGLNSFDGFQVYKHVGDDQGLSGPLENEIHHITVDRFNNKWFSTKGGLSLLRGDRSPWDVKGWLGYTTANSFLVDNNVQCVFVDAERNRALVATEGGLSIYQGPFAEIEEKFEKPPVGPNPFVLDGSGQKLVIKNLMFNSTVKILNINGKLVRELTPKTILRDGTIAVDGGRAYWDGLDKTGHKVASGVYLFLAISEEGKTVSGKIAVIRK